MSDHVATRRDDRNLIPGENLKAAQAVTATSSKKLARLLDVDDTSVYRWREGGSPITRMVWRACTQALGLPEDWKPGDDAPPAAKPQ